MEEDIESLIGELKVIADDTQDPFDKKRLKQIAEVIEKKNAKNTKCSTNMADPINLDSIFGEINMIGEDLERYGLQYNHFDTYIWKLGIRLNELYNKYKKYKENEV